MKLLSHASSRNREVGLTYVEMPDALAYIVRSRARSGLSGVSTNRFVPLYCVSLVLILEPDERTLSISNIQTAREKRLAATK